MGIQEQLKIKEKIDISGDRELINLEKGAGSSEAGYHRNLTEVRQTAYLPGFFGVRVDALACLCPASQGGYSPHTWLRCLFFLKRVVVKPLHVVDYV